MSGYYLLAGVVPHLPMLAVLIVGLVLVGRQRARLGARSATLAQLGLGLLILDVLAGAAWTMMIPQLYRGFRASAISFGFLSSGIGLAQSILMAAGVALLVAALVTRVAPGGGFPAGPAYGMAGAAPGYPAGPYSPVQPPGTYPPARPDNPTPGADDFGFDRPS